MATRKPPIEPIVEPKVWTSPDEIDHTIAKIQRRIFELESLNIPEAVLQGTGKGDVAISNVREMIREVFGQHSPEFIQNEYISLWSGTIYIDMCDGEVIECTERGKRHVIGILNGLIGRLNEKREELSVVTTPSSKAYLEYLNLHPRIADVASELFEDGHPWEAVFAAAKAIINYVKERSGLSDLDGAPLMRTVFSCNNPLLMEAFAKVERNG